MAAVGQFAGGSTGKGKDSDAENLAAKKKKKAIDDAKDETDLKKRMIFDSVTAGAPSTASTLAGGATTKLSGTTAPKLKGA